MFLFFYKFLSLLCGTFLDSSRTIQRWYNLTLFFLFCLASVVFSQFNFRFLSSCCFFSFIYHYHCFANKFGDFLIFLKNQNGGSKMATLLKVKQITLKWTRGYPCLTHHTIYFEYTFWNSGENIFCTPISPQAHDFQKSLSRIRWIIIPWLVYVCM